MKHGFSSFAAGVCLALSVASALGGCERDFSNAPGAGDIVFSADTLSFDTVFAGFATPTRRIMVRNVGDRDVTLDRIALAGGAASPFVVNIGGVSASEVGGVRLCSGDSLFVFAAVPDPRVGCDFAFGRLSDRLSVYGGGNEWSAALVAVVRNVNEAPSVVSSDAQWLCDSIPYLVRDTFVVDASATLLVGPGVSVLMDRGAVVSVAGRLVVAGESRRRSRFAPVRSDGFYESIPGQWGGVRLRGGASADLRYVDVACPSFGVECDSSSSVYADGVWVRDAARVGVSARRSDVVFSNSIVSDCGGGAFCFEGGRALLRHVTVADYYSWDYRQSAALLFRLADDPEASLSVVNSVIMGSLTAELYPDSLPVGHAVLRSSLIRADKKRVAGAAEVFIGCVTATDAHFRDRKSSDYHLTAKSAAAGLADPSLAADLPADFEGELREDGSPWHAGALQTIE